MAVTFRKLSPAYPGVMELRPSASPEGPRCSPWLQLELIGLDGASWTLTISRDCAQFIGRYARITGLAPGPLIDFVEPDAAD